MQSPSEIKLELLKLVANSLPVGASNEEYEKRLALFQNIVFKDSVQGSVEFVEEYLKLTSATQGQIPFHLRSYQKMILREIDNNQMVFINAARQLGMSSLACAYVAYFVATKEYDLTTVVTSNNWNNIQTLNERIAENIQNVPGLLIKKHNKDHIEVLNLSGNRHNIIFKNPDIHTARGFAHSLTIIDNASYISHSNGHDMWYSTMPSRMTNGKFIVIGNGGPKAGFFYDEMVSLTNNHNTSKIVLPYYVNNVNQQNFAQDMTSKIGKYSFEKEYLCQFYDLA